MKPEELKKLNRWISENIIPEYPAWEFGPPADSGFLMIQVLKKCSEKVAERNVNQGIRITRIDEGFMVSDQLHVTVIGPSFEIALAKFTQKLFTN